MAVDPENGLLHFPQEDIYALGLGAIEEIAKVDQPR